MRRTGEGGTAVIAVEELVVEEVAPRVRRDLVAERREVAEACHAGSRLGRVPKGWSGEEAQGACRGARTKRVGVGGLALGTRRAWAEKKARVATAALDPGL